MKDRKTGKIIKVNACMTNMKYYNKNHDKKITFLYDEHGNRFKHKTKYGLIEHKYTCRSRSEK